MTITWLLVNCNSLAEAKKIGRVALKKRLASCYDVWPRVASEFYWPPRKNKIESAKGATLVLVTLKSFTKRLSKVVEQEHSDKIPFIGSIKIEDVSKKYFDWVKGELGK
jgi:periplasmic divalent cation tolerance protein